MSNSSNFFFAETQRPKTPEIVDLGKLLPQQETPVPKTKMKTINWNKIPSNKLMGKNNIWTLVANSHQNSPMAELDWNEMEGLFCQQASTSQQNSPKMGARDTPPNSNDRTSNGSEKKSRKENSEVNYSRWFFFFENENSINLFESVLFLQITFLDGKRSLNINIFLKQFRT